MNQPSALPVARPLRCRLAPSSLPRGFTLTELLVVLTIVALLATVAMPSLATVMDSMRLSSASNSFLANLQLARSEAIKRNGRVVLCKSADGTACAGSGGWEQGWIVFHDANNNGAFDNGETVIERAQPLASGLKFTGNLSVNRYVSFVSTGATKLVSGAFQAGTFTLCQQSASGGQAHQIILNAVGRPRMQKVAPEACS